MFSDGAGELHAGGRRSRPGMWPFAPWGCCENHAEGADMKVTFPDAPQQQKQAALNAVAHEQESVAKPSRSAALSAAPHAQAMWSLPSKVLAMRLFYLSPP